ncbi:MAG: methionine--tRNA ligase [Acidiferrobacteraceae bacterium]|nr:methionine--tRNA ligase [Acidiferrobacteraceae bacterium]
MTCAPRKILVTSALPYANGPIHLGHLVEYIQTDIWVRFQRLKGHAAYYVCAEDTHGTPIMLKAREEGITPEALIERIGAEHDRDFADFNITFDNYYTTHSDENRYFSEFIFQQLQSKGHIEERTITQAYDPVEEMFLPDRFIRGTCPRCAAEDQNGDNCEVCGATYAPTDLSDAVSVISGAAPVPRESEHYFVRLADFEAMLRDWTGSGRLQPEVVNKLNEWFEIGLQDWDISRDAPYFGFEIPGTTGKYFYVWLDAPIGYIASFRHFCNSSGVDFDAFWAADAAAELYHFVGKDILYFHTLFWPAMLHGAGFRTPTAVFTHGFLTINGQKMSKSRGTFITARTYLEHLDPDYLRYYFAARLNNRVEDIDFNVEDFVTRVNADLVGKVVNIASRCAGFIEKGFDGWLSAELPDPALAQKFSDQHGVICGYFENREFSRAIRDIMALADIANQYINDVKPWVIAKDQSRADELQAVCTQGLNLFRMLVTWLAPVVPQLADRSAEFLRHPLATGSALNQLTKPLIDHQIGPFSRLLDRIAAEAANAMMEDTQLMNQNDSADPSGRHLDGEPISPQITIDEFAKVDLRVVCVKAAEAVAGADRLLKLTLDLGGEVREVFAGIKSAYDPAALVGRHVVMVANLAPRKMRFGVSNGMILAASGTDDAGGIFLLAPDEGAEPGMRVR